MKVVVDHSLCEGHAKCMEHAPEMFQVGDDDLSRPLLDDIPDALMIKVERAVQGCPRAAIALVEE